MLLVDELLLLAVAAENEGWGLAPDGQPVVAPRMTVAAAVAVLADLALLGRVVPGREVVDVESTGDADLDAALGVVAAQEQAIAAWVRAVAATRPDLARLSRLRADRVLTEYDSRAATPARRLFAPEDGPEVAILGRLHRALARGSGDPSTVALAELVRATGLHERWFRGTSAQERESRLAALLPADGWITGALT
ncbi:GPP34 family phosphoprotein [Actinophytocola sp. KF-1]